MVLHSITGLFDWQLNYSVSTTVPKPGRRGRNNNPSAAGELLHSFNSSLSPGKAFRSTYLPLLSVRLRKMSIISVYPIVSTYNRRRYICGNGISTASAWAGGPALGQAKARAGWAPVGITAQTHR